MTYPAGFAGDLAAAIDYARNHGAPPDAMVKLQELASAVMATAVEPVVAPKPNAEPPVTVLTPSATDPIPKAAEPAKDAETLTLRKPK